MANNSCYEDQAKGWQAPCKSTCLLPSMAKSLLHMARNATIYVSSIAGSVHSPGSAHYDGVAFDIGTYSGLRLSKENGKEAEKVFEACEKYGASKIFNINRECGQPCQSHTTWVHCRWYVKSDKACLDEGGFCWDADKCADKNGAARDVLCTKYPVTRTCCTDVATDAKCAAVKGTCQAAQTCETKGWTWRKGLCRGLPDEVQCCIPVPEPSLLLPGRNEGVSPRDGDLACTARGGLCYQDGRQACPWHWMQTPDACAQAEGARHVCCAPHVADSVCTAEGGVCMYTDRLACPATRKLRSGLCGADQSGTYRCCAPSPEDAECTRAGGSCGRHGHEQSSTCSAPRKPVEGLCGALADSAYTCCADDQAVRVADAEQSARAAAGAAASMWPGLCRGDVGPAYEAPAGGWETDDQLCARYGIAAAPRHCDRTNDELFRPWVAQMSRLRCPEQALEATQWVRDATHTGPGVQCLLCGRYWSAKPYASELVDLGRCADQDKVIGLQRCCYNEAGVLPIESIPELYSVIGVDQDSSDSAIATAAAAVGEFALGMIQAISKSMQSAPHRSAYKKRRIQVAARRSLRGSPWRGPPPVAGRELPRERRERCICGAEEWLSRQHGGTEEATNRPEALAATPAVPLATPSASVGQMKAAQDGQVVHACLAPDLAKLLAGAADSNGTVCPSSIPLDKHSIAARLIWQMEDFKPNAYKDPLDPENGPITIGFGSTKKDDGSSFVLGDTITREQAEELSLKTMREYWDTLTDTVPLWDRMNPYQKGALLSFAYNLGKNFYGHKGFGTISKVLAKGPCEDFIGNNVESLKNIDQRARDSMGWGPDHTTKFSGWDLVPHAMALYINPESSVKSGLLRRRIAEGELFRRCGTACSGAGSDHGESNLFKAAFESWGALDVYWGSPEDANDKKCIAAGGSCMLQSECDQELNRVRSNLCRAPASKKKRCCVPRASDPPCIAQEGRCTRQSGCGSASNIWKKGLCRTFSAKVRCCVPKPEDPTEVGQQQQSAGKVEGTHEWQCGPLRARLTLANSGDRRETLDRLGQWQGNTSGPHQVSFSHAEARRMDQGLLRNFDVFLARLNMSCSTVPLHVKVLKGWSTQSLHPNKALYYGGRALRLEVERAGAQTGSRSAVKTCLNSIREDASRSFRYAALPALVLQQCMRGRCKDVSSVDRHTEESKGYYRHLEGRFDDVVGGSTAMFVMFYAGWDSKAADLRPAWHRLSSHVFNNPQIRGRVQVSSVDVTHRTSGGLIKRFGLQGSPELHWFPARSTAPAEKYPSDRALSDAHLFEYVNQKLGLQPSTDQTGPFLDVQANPPIPTYPDQQLPLRLFVCEQEGPRGASTEPEADQDDPPCPPRNLELPGHVMLAAYGQPVPMVRLPDGLQGVPMFSTTPAESSGSGGIDTSVLEPYLFFENGMVRQAVFIPGGPAGGTAGARRHWAHAQGSWRRTRLLQAGTTPTDPAELCEMYKGRVLVPSPSRSPATAVLDPEAAARGSPPQQPGIVCIFSCGEGDCQSYAELRAEQAALRADGGGRSPEGEGAPSGRRAAVRDRSYDSADRWSEL
eukprot:TRINITY_DN11699_c0_g3_i1.p1 TRINITY_DN11699_c0_g3~~TRINITY_DN11699_c0_g3_i1.p1  ORF type:complete len:1653 (+),score=268.16 TRINITY_DN11699_c0_g3_i1:269-4960(+)